MLRRSPRRTPALLAANRANARKSTGPRTTQGKQRSAGNAYLFGNRASKAFWMRTLVHRELADYLALRDTIDAALLDSTEGRKLSAAAADLLWAMKRIWERELRRLPAQERGRLATGLLGLPRPCHRTIRCSLQGPDGASPSGQRSLPDHDSARGLPRFGHWKVTITLLMRRGRHGSRVGTRRAGCVAHVIAKVTCTGHPLLDPESVGVALRTKATRTKPECYTGQGSYENISPLCNCSGRPVGGAGSAAPFVRKQRAASAAASAPETTPAPAAPESWHKRKHWLAAKFKAWAATWLQRAAGLC